MKKLLALMFLVCGCNFNAVYIEKHIYVIESEGILIEMTGSSLDDVLKGNSQKADGSLEVPLNKNN